MNIYKLINTKFDDYEEYRSLIVVAENEDEARKMHPYINTPLHESSFYYRRKYNDFVAVFTGEYSAWCNPANVEVILIGQAGDWYWEPKVISVDFNAG